MAYKVNNGSSFSGLTFGFDRYAYEGQHEIAVAESKEVTNEAYLGSQATAGTEMLHQMRLHTLNDYLKRKRAQEQQAAESERKEAYKVSF